MNSDKLDNICSKCLDYIKVNSFDAGTEKSELWDGLLTNRKNFPNSNDFQSFFANDYASGLGIPAKQTAKAELERFKIIDGPTKLYGVPEDFFHKLSEPEFGKPYLFDHSSGKKFSANYIRNSANGYDIYNKLKNKKDLVILEIGGGMGLLSNILHQILDIKQYVLIDLPENLYLSSVYLQSTLNREASYVDDNTNRYDTPIVSTIPKFIDNIGLKYDLVVNVNSFGEMPLQIVREYLNFIKNNLKDDGYFYSQNRIHAVLNIDGPSRLSDYLVKGMKIDNLMARSSNTYIDFQSHHRMFLKKSGVQQPLYSDYIDIVGEFINLGLYELIEDLAGKIVEEKLDDADIEFLDILKRFFATRDITEKYEIISSYDSDNKAHRRIIICLMLLIQYVKHRFDHALYDEFLELTDNGIFENHGQFFIALLAHHSGHSISKRLKAEIYDSKFFFYKSNLDWVNKRANLGIKMKVYNFINSIVKRRYPLESLIRTRLHVS